MISPEVLEELDRALQAVSDVLSKVTDADWNTVIDIQDHINQSQELCNRIESVKM